MVQALLFHVKYDNFFAIIIGPVQQTDSGKFLDAYVQFRQVNVGIEAHAACAHNHHCIALHSGGLALALDERLGLGIGLGLGAELNLVISLMLIISLLN